MIALIKKDIATMKKTLLVTTLICAFLIVYGIKKSAIYMLPLLCIMLPLMLGAIAFGYDSKSKFEILAFSMPIKKSSYVLSKLFFAFIFGILGASASFIYFSIKNFVPLEYMLIISISIFLLTLLVSSIQLPFILKFGEEKGRLIMVVTYFLIFASSSILKDKTEWAVNFIKQISKYSTKLILIAIILLTIVLIAGLIGLSIKILDKKEY